MPNPTLDQITRNPILLENGNSPVAERMGRSDWDSDLLAEWLQNKAIHIPIDQRRSVAALEDATRCTIAKIRLNDRHCVRVYVHFSMAGFTLRGHFLMNESGPSDVNDQLREVQILDVKTSYLSESHARCRLQCEKSFVLALGRFDQLLHLLGCEVALLCFRNFRQTNRPITCRFPDDKFQDLPHVADRLRRDLTVKFQS